MNVALKPELRERIEAEVKAGRASDASEFLNMAVYHYLLALDLGQEYSREDFDRMIYVGLTDIEQGDTVEGEEVFRSLQAFAETHRRQRS